ncbi:MAG: hypothetical protein JWM33_1238 [Caulobacteraceae bacterium]|nr:hypothetical protein [Caulobacteraceae bacterium]
MQALVTGATGGLGRALTETLLLRGWRVSATGRDLKVGAELEAMGAKFAPGDFADWPRSLEGLIPQGGAVIHAAALSSPWGSAQAFEDANLHATRNLLLAAQSGGASSLVFVSTPSIYAEARDRLGLTEDSPLAARFVNHYARTKYLAERAVLAANQPGLSTLVVRPRALVGRHDRVLLPRLLRVARTGVFPLFRGGRALIELTDVRDAAEGIAIAAERAESLGGRTFNLSSGQPRPLIELLDLVFAAKGLSPRLIPLPYTPAAAGAGLSEVICACLPGRPEPRTTRYALTTLAFSQTFDLSAARGALAWAPARSPADAINWALGGQG